MFNFTFMQRSTKLLEESRAEATAGQEELNDSHAALTSARQQLAASREDLACSETKVFSAPSICLPSSPYLDEEHL